ncbi:hypothetical protein psal_cds_1320 [Pandoravirus salinus]|uniref:Uncharacterized protein n=1 Tax=Pandoravirus salinus TaxID=1349410 RepID=S4W4P6_9VIRU|nr:hypothetical protein psal_cds_1320 [Pandoravirus salinus]AGO85697.1 hypothetical protein psal_cds_1320 [Pandoravirus salinus]
MTRYSKKAILLYAMDHGCPWDETVAARMAAIGKPTWLACVRERGCPWDARTTAAAVDSKNWTCFDYAIRHGCPCAPDTMTLAKALGWVQS